MLVEATVGLEPTTYCLGVHLEHDFKNRSTKVKVAFIRMVMRYYDLFIVQSSFPYFLPLTETERKWNLRDLRAPTARRLQRHIS